MNRGSRHHQLIIITLVATVLFMEFMDISIINTAVTTIAKDFMINPVLLKFSVASYYLGLAIFIPISGTSTDKFGIRPIFTLAVILFIAASLACALSHNALQLAFFRFVQGAGGAFMVPLARIVLLRTIPQDKRMRANSIVFTIALVGWAAGPFIGGVITYYYSWQWIFYINIPVGIMVITAGYKYIEKNILDKSRIFDITGFFLAAVFFSSITIFIEILDQYKIISALWFFLSSFVGLASFICLMLHCAIKNNAIFDFSLFKILTLRMGFMISFATFCIGTGLAFMLPLMFQTCLNYTSLQSGLLSLAYAFGLATTCTIAMRITPHFGFKKTVLCSLGLAVISIILLGQIKTDTSLYYIIICQMVCGGAITISKACMGGLIYVDVPKNKFPVATAMDQSFSQLFSSMGIGISVLTLRLMANYFDLPIYSSDPIAFRYSFYILALIMAITMMAIFIATDVGIIRKLIEKHKRRRRNKMVSDNAK